MARYRFKPSDLNPLRPFLEHPLAKEALQSVRPVKQFAPLNRHVEELNITLPVVLQGRDNPDGVPLDKILESVRSEVPDVQSIKVSGGRVFVTRSATPTTGTTKKIGTILTDTTRLNNLKPTITGTGATGTGVTGTVTGTVLTGTVLTRAASLPAADARKLLLDPKTSDADWIKTFRAWAVDNLFKTE